MIEVESLNRQAQELMERTSSDQAVAIREPLADINKRWDDLLKNIVQRQVIFLHLIHTLFPCYCMCMFMYHYFWWQIRTISYILFYKQQEMENTLLRLGQFQHALDELVIWISKTESTLDELKPVFGDPQVIEVVLAKHKVINFILFYSSFYLYISCYFKKTLLLFLFYFYSIFFIHKSRNFVIINFFF